MQSIDWRKIIANDTNLEHPSVNDPYLASTEEYQGQPYIRTRESDPRNQFEGYVNTYRAIFADISGDGQQETIIPVDDGGSHAHLWEGVIVYGVKNNIITLIGTLKSHQLFDVRVDDNQMVFQEPIYQGWESLCCPSGFTETRYRFEIDHFVAVNSTWFLEPQNRRMMVESFYSRLSSKDYRAL